MYPRSLVHVQLELQYRKITEAYRACGLPRTAEARERMLEHFNLRWLNHDHVRHLPELSPSDLTIEELEAASPFWKLTDSERDKLRFCILNLPDEA